MEYDVEKGRNPKPNTHKEYPLYLKIIRIQTNPKPNVSVIQTYWKSDLHNIPYHNIERAQHNLRHKRFVLYVRK